MKRIPVMKTLAVLLVMAAMLPMLLCGCGG